MKDCANEKLAAIKNVFDSIYSRGNPSYLESAPGWIDYEYSKDFNFGIYYNSSALYVVLYKGGQEARRVVLAGSLRDIFSQLPKDLSESFIYLL
jgi:hypothetical protein